VVVGLTDVDAALGKICGGRRVADADRERRVGRAAQDLLDVRRPSLPWLR